MTAAIAWLIGSPLGRKIALTGLAALAIALVALRIYSAGRASAKAEAAQRSLDLLRTRISTDDEISSLPAADRRKRLEEWSIN
jgi:hypothetical protein